MQVSGYNEGTWQVHVKMDMDVVDSRMQMLINI